MLDLVKVQCPYPVGNDTQCYIRPEDYDTQFGGAKIDADLCPVNLGEANCAKILESKIRGGGSGKSSGTNWDTKSSIAGALFTGMINLVYAVRRASGAEEWQGLLWMLAFPWSIASWGLIKPGSQRILGWNVNRMLDFARRLRG